MRLALLSFSWLLLNTSGCSTLIQRARAAVNGQELNSAPSSAAAPRKVGTPTGAVSATSLAASRAQRQSIFAVDQGTFRIQLAYDRVWEASLDVLLRNYNLSIADRMNGLITTEWDSYYLDGKLHRNKLSLRLKKLPGNFVELMVFNNVEALSKLPEGGITEIWLPTDRNKTEIGRIVQNMAIAMGQPRPELPEELQTQAQTEPASDKARF